MANSEYIRRYIISLFFTFFLGGIAQAFPGKYPVYNFTPNEYKAGIQNIDFAQNRDMTLFVANNLGVLSFDGNEWNTHDFNTGIKKRSLAFDDVANRLYVGSQGAFGYYETDWKYVSLSSLIPEAERNFDEVWDVFLLNDQVYFCTFQAIYVYDGKDISIIKHPDGLERSYLAAGNLFTQTQHGQLLKLEGKELIASFPQLQSDKNIAGVVPHNNGYLLFYNSGHIEWTTLIGVSEQYEDLISVLEGTYVNHVLQLSDTRLAISTQTAGLFLYDLQTRIIEKISRAEGLGSNACLRSFQDYFGNLWVGMQNGIALIYINSPLRLINQEINLQGSGYEAFETAEGTYFTTSNGIYFLPVNGTSSKFLKGTAGPAYGIQEIAGKLYAGHHTGLFLLEDGNATQLAQTDGLWQIKQLSSNPKYAIGGTYGGLFLFELAENQLLKPVQKVDGFNSSSRFFEEDAFGKIWVGQYYRGLYQLALSEDLGTASIQNVLDTSSAAGFEQIILGQAAGGLYTATKTGFRRLNPSDAQIEEASMFSEAIGKQFVYLFNQDHKNNIHVVAENTMGFYRQISPNNYQFVPSSLYQFRYHLNNDLLQTSINTEEGVLFSANEGFIHYFPKRENPVKVEKPLLIDRIYSVTENKALYQRAMFGERPQEIEPIVLSPKARVVQFDIAFFDFNNLNNQQFRYYLKGLENDFGGWTNVPNKEYSNLKEGTYEFVAETRNYLGEIKSIKPLSIRVRPPFYRSLLAKIIYIILGVLILFFSFRWERKQYQKKTQELEEAQRLKLAKEQDRLKAIEQQKEKEVLQLKEEKMQSELQHVQNLLAASTMNLVVKNEFIESIKEELKALKQKGKNQETKQALEKVVKEIDITLRLQEDWEQFEYHFDQVHGGFLNRLRSEYPDLSPNEQKLCALLRLNLNTKEIANLLSISLRGVEVARYRLRKKLTLETGQNLSKFILEY